MRLSCQIILLEVTTTRFGYTHTLTSWMMDRFTVTDRMVSARESGVKAEVYLCAQRHPPVSRDSRLPGVCYVSCVLVCTCVCASSHACTPLPFVSLHTLSSHIKVIRQTNCYTFTASLHSISFLDDDTFYTFSHLYDEARIYKTVSRDFTIFCSSFV